MQYRWYGVHDMDIADTFSTKDVGDIIFGKRYGEKIFLPKMCVYAIRLNSKHVSNFIKREIQKRLDIDCFCYRSRDAINITYSKRNGDVSITLKENIMYFKEKDVPIDKKWCLDINNQNKWPILIPPK